MVFAPSPSIGFKDDRTELTSSVDISNYFNEYFCNIGTNLVTSLPSCTNCFTEYLELPSCNSIYVDPVTRDEMLKLISSLSCKKSCGPDGISPQLLKDHKYLFVEPLLYIFNLSISTGVVPDKMKIAKVIPIYKKGVKSSAGNYRPISLLNLLNKLLEKIIHKRVYGFLNRQHFFYKYQFGFRHNHSTSLALLEVMDMCYKNLDVDSNIVAIFLICKKLLIL